MHRQGIATRSNLQEEKGSDVVMILQPLCVFYLLPIRDTFDQQLPSFILPANIDQYYSQCVRACARAFRT